MRARNTNHKDDQYTIQDNVRAVSVHEKLKVTESFVSSYLNIWPVDTVIVFFFFFSFLYLTRFFCLLRKKQQRKKVVSLWGLFVQWKLLGSLCTSLP